MDIRPGRSRGRRPGMVRAECCYSASALRCHRALAMLMLAARMAANRDLGGGKVWWLWNSWVWVEAGIRCRE